MYIPFTSVYISHIDAFILAAKATAVVSDPPRPKVVISKFSLKSLITKLKMPLNKIAIELNKKIIDKKRISKIFLQNGDQIEIVHFIGGG